MSRTASPVAGDDPRRRIPRTDALLALEEVERAKQRLGEERVRDVVRDVQSRARAGEVVPEEVEGAVIAALESVHACTFTPVLNATGVIVHTNLGRAPLSPQAIDALEAAAGYVDVEFDLATGLRGKRGVSTREALLKACPAAQDALAVNNGAAALSLIATALAGPGSGKRREIVLSRGEMIEIGAGFRLTELIESTGPVIHEVGTTNRTHLADYEKALGESTAALLKIHASNYVIKGFTSAVGIAELADLAHAHDLPLIVDIGSGLFSPEPLLPDEPTLTEALEQGADLVLASGDKLVGGPQAGLILGKKEWVERVARHPLARAMRADKLLLAALEATVAGPTPPVLEALHTEPAALKTRTEKLARAIHERVNVMCEVVPHDGRVGGGGGAEVPIPGWALRVPEHLASELRALERPIIATTRDGACLIDVRCIPEFEDDELASAIAALMKR